MIKSIFPDYLLNSLFLTHVAQRLRNEGTEEVIQVL